MSKRSKTRRSLGPRRKRLRRPARLEAARGWIASPRSETSEWVEFGGVLVLPVGYTEGGCPFGPTLDDLDPEEREAVLAELRSEPSGHHRPGRASIHEPDVAFDEALPIRRGPS